MRMKLTPQQIYVLSSLIRTALEENPTPKIDEGEVEDLPKSDEYVMEPWEAALKLAVDSHPLLPSYEFLEKTDSVLVEFLVEYFDPSEEEDDDGE